MKELNLRDESIHFDGALRLSKTIQLTVELLREYKILVDMQYSDVTSRVSFNAAIESYHFSSIPTLLLLFSC